MATIRELLTLGKEKLENSGNEYAKYERKVLLEEVLGCNYMYMLMNGEEEVSGEKEKKYLSLLERRCAHYPLQYLLGYAYFMDYTFYVNENVLIPRNDTEILVECANKILGDVTGNFSTKTEQEEKGKSENSVQVLDLCCGTGCIGISLKLYHQGIALTLADVSKEALEVTKRNLEKHDVKGELICSSLFQKITGKMDMIVSNPPYIESGVIDTLMPEVKDHEPLLALDGGEDGLDFYRKITMQAPEYLNTGGWLLFEIGYNQKEAVLQIMKAQGFKDIAVKTDYAGLDRVVYGHL